jgi:hypothetical protein
VIDGLPDRARCARDARFEPSLRPATALHRLVEKVATTFYRRTVVLAQSIPPPDAADGTRRLEEVDLASLKRVRRRAVELHDLSVSDIADYLRLRPDQTAELVRRRLARGDRCRVVRRDAGIVHAGWLARDRVDVPYLDGQLVLGAGDLYSYDSFTAPGWRGRWLAPARHLDLLSGAAGREARRLLVLVAVENRSGLRVFAKLGYRTVGRYTMARLGPWRRWWIERPGDEALPVLVPGRAS